MASAEVQKHNQTLLRELEPGDIVSFPRRWYSHYAVYSGNGQVIHLSGENDGIGDGWQSNSAKFTIAGRQFDKAFVKEENFFKVAMTSKAHKSNKDDKCNPIGRGWRIVQRAREKIGEIGYNVLWHNCEHFAAWCRYGKSWSEQVDSFLTWGTIGLAVGGLAAMAIGMSRSRRNQNTS